MEDQQKLRETGSRTGPSDEAGRIVYSGPGQGGPQIEGTKLCGLREPSTIGLLLFIQGFLKLLINLVVYPQCLYMLY